MLRLVSCSCVSKRTDLGVVLADAVTLQILSIGWASAGVRKDDSVVRTTSKSSPTASSKNTIHRCKFRSFQTGIA